LVITEITELLEDQGNQRLIHQTQYKENENPEKIKKIKKQLAGIRSATCPTNLRHPHSRPSPSSSSAQHGHEEEALSQEDLAVASELEASGRSRGRAGLERRAGGWD
jgi:ribosomal protein L29